jgi:hypothetical protein
MVGRIMQRFYTDRSGSFIGSIYSAMPDPNLIEISAPPAGIASPEYIDGAWREYTSPIIPVSTDPQDHILSPAQFTWLLAVSGLDDVTDTVLAYAKANDRPKFADLKMALGRSKFTYAATMQMIELMSAAIPPDVDVSPAFISDLWLRAKDKG